MNIIRTRRRRSHHTDMHDLLNKKYKFSAFIYPERTCILD
jgi:hypothetical protein